MDTLIDEVPEAKQFVEHVINNVDYFYLFPDEKFETVFAGVLTTTSPDLQGEVVTRKALEKIVTGTRGTTRWLLAEHNPLIQPIGRTLAAESFYSKKSDVHFIASVVGYYDPKKLPTFADAGIELPSSSDKEGDKFAIIDMSGTHAWLLYSPHEIAPEVIEEILATAPSLVERQPQRAVRKAAEPLSILTVVVSIHLLLANPFSKAFLQTLGKRSGDAVADFFAWLLKSVVGSIKRWSSRETLFELRTEVEGCLIQFVVPAKDPALVIEATEKIYDGARSATSLAEQIKHLEPEKIIYEFDANSRQWLPLHAATRKMGVISNRPHLIALDRYKGLSIGGQSLAEK